jgi:uncharacterized protein YbjT (DUF2867 family)
MSHFGALRRPFSDNEKGAEMEIAVVGGSGTLGAPVVEALTRRGHSVRTLSRSGEHRVDVTTGEGLVEALIGVETVVDASNGQKNPELVLVEGTRRLLAAEAEAGVGHHVLPSIVGTDRVPRKYFRLKLEQERLVREGPLPWSILRATQFHQLLDSMFGALARYLLSPRSRSLLQPVDPREVAAALAEGVEQGPWGDGREVGGPDLLTLSDLARIWSRAQGRTLLPLPIPLGAKAGALTVPEATGTLGFAEWLDEQSRNNRQSVMAEAQPAAR